MLSRAFLQADPGEVYSYYTGGRALSPVQVEKCPQRSPGSNLGAHRCSGQQEEEEEKVVVVLCAGVETTMGSHRNILLPVLATQPAVAGCTLFLMHSTPGCHTLEGTSATSLILLSSPLVP